MSCTCKPDAGRLSVHDGGCSIFQEAKHFDDNKLPLQHILAMPIIEEMAKVAQYGEKKYGDYYNYRKGMPWMKLLGSCTRHLRAFIRGENNDPESGLPHLAHLAYDTAMLWEYLELHPKLDNRPSGIK